MASNSNDYTPQQYRKYNGQSVLKALREHGNEASADELAQQISEEIGATTEIILPEVKRVLRRGIVEGFLERSGTVYSLVGENYSFQVDSAPRRKRRFLKDIEVDVPKRRRVSNPSRVSKRRLIRFDEEEDEEEEDDEEQESEDNYKDITPEESEMEEQSSSEEDESLDRPFIAFRRRNT